MRTFVRGEVSIEVEIVGTRLLIRRYSGSDESEASERECGNPLRAKWDADKLGKTFESEGFERSGDTYGATRLGHEVFEQALREDPDDVETYLVYADWLLEGGDVWGELMSLQCARAQLPRFGAGERRDEIGRHETRLLFEHSARFWGRLGEQIVDEFSQRYASDCIEAEWFCGFVRSARVAYSPMPLGSLISTFASLPIAQLVRSLAIADDGIVGSGLAAIGDATWPVLSEIEVADDDAFLHDGQRFFVAPMLALLDGKRAPRLEKINVRGFRDGRDLCQAIARSPVASSLRSLRLGRGDFDAAALAALESSDLSLDELVLIGQGLPAEPTPGLRRLAKRVRVAPT